MTDSSLRISAPAAAPSETKSKAHRALAAIWPRAICGIAILSIWEVVVRSFAPPYVAKPSSIFAAIPKVVVDPAFLEAAGTTLLAVAEGLFIAIILGTLIGLLIGRNQTADRMLRHYVNGFYAIPMIVVLPLVTLWFGYS